MLNPFTQVIGSEGGGVDIPIGPPGGWGQVTAWADVGSKKLPMKSVEARAVPSSNDLRLLHLTRSEGA